MSAIVLDAGALMAIERSDRAMLRALELAYRAGRRLRTHPLVLAQVWRTGSGRQATLARFLHSVRVVTLDEAAGRRTGVLLLRAGTSDAVDAALVDLAQTGDVIITSDPTDITVLIKAAGADVAIQAC